MSGRGWLHSFALGGCLTLALLAGEGSAQNDSPAPTQQAQQQQGQTEQAPTTNEPEQEPKAEYYKPSCDKPPQREDDDLCQQRRMAQAAEDAVVLSLVFTGWAALAAAIAAKAARAAVGVASDTANHQLRAYVGPSGAKLEWPQADSPVGVVQIKNFGQTPAYDVQHWGHIWIAAHPLNEKLPDPPAQFSRSRSIVYPQSYLVLATPKEPPVPARSVHLLGTAKGTVYVYGEIRYRDCFGEPRWTRYRFMYGGSEPHPERELMKADIDGNEAN